jgi:hypothetical protein
MKQIDTNLNKKVEYGNPKDGIVTVDSFDKKIASYADNLEKYNQALDLADSLKSTLKAQVKSIGIDNATVLNSAPTLFGKNSEEVVLLGGKKVVDRKRPTKKGNTKTN